LPNLENDQLAQAQKLKDQCKYKEALETLTTIENANELTADDQIRFYLLQSRLFYVFGQMTKVLDTADLVYKKSKEIGNDLGMLDASLSKGIALRDLGKYKEWYHSILECEELISKIKDQPENLIGKRKVELSLQKGWYYWNIGKFDKLLEYSKKCLALSEKYGTKRDVARAFVINGLYYNETGDFTKALENYEKNLKIIKETNDKPEMAWAYNNIGTIYGDRGDLDRGLEYYEQSLALHKEMGRKIGMAVSLGNIALTYYEKGELDKSLNYLKKTLQLFKALGNNYRISQGLFYIILMYLDQNDIESAQACLEEIRKIKDIEENPRIEYRFLIAKALILKKIGGTRNIIRAEDILKKLLTAKSIEHVYLVMIILNLCELFLSELQISKEAAILEDITPLITRLLEIAETTHSFLLLAEGYLFKAKLEILNLELDEAQHLFTRAQQITQQYHLSRLEKKISLEHDQFLEKLDLWEELKTRNAPLAERLKLVSLEGDLSLMMRKQAIEDVEILPEEPLLLSIISKGGVSLFSHFFSKEWEEKQMFSSFMDAFNAFSHEFFAKTLDRVKIGENTIIMSPFEDKFLCYVIRGQSYPAQQKLIKFSEGIKNSKDILEAINRSYSTGAILNEENTPVLGELVNTIFA